MIINIDTTLGAGTSITLPINITTQTVSVDWGDGTVDANKSHTYASDGTYTIEIVSYTGTSFGSNSWSSPEFVVSVSSFGSIPWVNFDGSFNGCSNLTSVPTTLPATVNATAGMFKDCVSFNQDISGWNTSNITRMSGMFQGATIFNQPLNSWDVSNVLNFSESNPLNNVTFGYLGMFTDAVSFNQPLDNWDTSSALRMGSMFERAYAFNQDISSWNTSNVIDMSSMFQGSDFFGTKTNFSQNLNTWDTSSVIDMSRMFNHSNFNGEILDWDTSSVQAMDGMFSFNTQFNQPIYSWDVSNVVSMGYDGTSFLVIHGMFEGATSFNQNLNTWNIGSLQYAGSMFEGATSFADGNVSQWDTTGIFITDWLTGTVSGPAVPIPVIREDLALTVVPIIRNIGGVFTVVGNNLAYTSYILDSAFAYYVVEYKLNSLGGDWQLLGNLTQSNIFAHTKSKGFVFGAEISYRVTAWFYDVPPTFQTAEQTVGTANVARYDTASAADYIVQEIIWDDDNNLMKLKVETPQPSGLNTNISGSPGAWQFYRVRDIETQRILGVEILGEEAQGAISSRGYYSGDTFPITGSTQNTTEIGIMLPIGLIQKQDAGFKGVTIEFGYVFSLSKPKPTATLSATKGILHFYPDSSDLPAGPIWDPDTGEKKGTGQGEPPTTPPPGTKGPIIFDPIDQETFDIVPIAELIEIKDGNGDTVASGRLPEGTPPNPIYTVRYENDYITVIYDGQIIVTYKIDPDEYPNLANSQGWIGFVDTNTGLPIPAPAGATLGLLPEGGSLYQLNASDLERPLGYNHPLYYQYGARQQGYTILEYANGTVDVILEPTTDQLKQAVNIYRGGSTYEITPATALAISNAGYGRWVEVIR